MQVSFLLDQRLTCMQWDFVPLHRIKILCVAILILFLYSRILWTYFVRTVYVLRHCVGPALSRHIVTSQYII
jgi:hypothetical protein